MDIIGACPHDCPDTCSMLTTVEGGIAIKVHGNPAHPQTAGALCTKVSRYTERSYHPERLKHPMKRVGKKGEGRFAAVSWEEAIADICSRLGQIAQERPDSIVPYSYAGTMGKVQGEAMAARFFNKLGGARLYRSICAEAGAQALELTYGHLLGMRVEFFAESKLILIWGSNPITSSVHFWRYAQEAKRQGAKLICIDPRKTETAEKCHEHLAILPGTDAALAFALMHELIQNDCLDHDYIAQHSLGFEQLKARALSWPPERAAAVCGVSVEQIKSLARDYGATPSPAIRLNYGMQRVRGGGNAVRAVACLPTLVGAWRQRSGGLLLSSSGSFRFNSTALERPDLLAGKQPRSVNMTTIGQDLLDPQQDIRALIVYNSNPLAIAPDSSSVAKGLAREDLFTVVLEHFQTDSADYADYLLPATTQLEHWDIHKTYGHTDILLNRPAIAPLHQAKPNIEIFRLLARGMGYTDACFNEDDETLCRQALVGVPQEEAIWHDLLGQGFHQLALAEAPFAQGGFTTPSGKCEFFSQTLADSGFDGLPEYLPNYEPANQDPRYPLAMISPPARHFMNSTFVNVESLADKERCPLIEIHPSDAEQRDIKDGDAVKVFNARGDYHCHAKVSTRAKEGVVNGLGVWWRKLGANHTNVNELTSQALTDLGAAPVFYDCAVQVELLND